jgi:hypothetical protein
MDNKIPLTPLEDNKCTLGIFIGSFFVLLIGLLTGRAENIAHSQTSEFDPRKFDPLQTYCVPSMTNI